LFFYFFKGQIFQAGGRDDLSISMFFEASLLCPKLTLETADKSVPFSGLGSILCKIEEYELALRCYLKVKMPIMHLKKG